MRLEVKTNILHGTRSRIKEGKIQQELLNRNFESFYKFYRRNKFYPLKAMLIEILIYSY